MLLERSFHLTRFDTIASYFHLIIGAPLILDLTIRTMTREIACAIESRARFPTERIWDEFLRGQGRQVQVIASYTGTADVQLATHSDRHRPQKLIQQVNLNIVDGSSNRRRFAFRLTQGDRGADCCLAWSICIEELSAFGPSRNYIRRAGFAGDNDSLQCR